jgi:hypothetical protein
MRLVVDRLWIKAVVSPRRLTARFLDPLPEACGGIRARALGQRDAPGQVSVPVDGCLPSARMPDSGYLQGRRISSSSTNKRGRIGHPLINAHLGILGILDPFQKWQQHRPPTDETGYQGLPIMPSHTLWALCSLIY